LIGEPLANDTHKGALSALDVVYAKPNAVAVSEIELGKIAVQMALTTMLINTFHATLEDAVKSFDGIRVNVAAHVFTGFMTDALMAGEMVAEREIMSAFIGHHRGFFCNIGLDDRDYIGCAGSLNTERANLPAVSIHERKNRILVAMATALDSSVLAANEGFIRFNYATNAAHWHNADSPHRFANALRHEPCGFQSYAEGPVELVA
jgi:hypothetical protein